MNSLEISTNCTTRFLLPIVFPNTTFEELIANGFIKAYIGMLDDEQYDDSLLLLFEKNTEEEILEELLNNVDAEIVEEYIDDELQLIVVHDWVDKLGEEDYPNFLSGTWSELEIGSKESILSFWGEDENSMLYKILHKDPKFKDIIEDFTSTLFISSIADDVGKNEYWPKPDVIEDELYYSGDL